MTSDNWGRGRLMAESTTELNYSSKTLLLVEDDDSFRGTLQDSLQNVGYSVMSVPNGKIAQEIFVAKQFDAVISDIKMPEVNGLELLQFIQKTRPLPVILMTGFTELANNITAFNHGATDFISKPFKRAEITRILDKCFGFLEPEEIFKEGDLCSLKIDDFVSGKEIKYGLFVKNKDHVFVKIANFGENLSWEKILTYKEKGLNSLYLKKDDYKKHIIFTINLCKAVTTSSVVSREKQLLILKNTAELVLNLIFQDGPDEDSIEFAKIITQLMVSMIKTPKDLTQFFEILKSIPNRLYAHSIGVSIVSGFIAKGLAWNSASGLSKLAVGGFLQDLGMTKIARELLQKPIKDYSKDELKTYQKHVYLGVTLLKKNDLVPAEVISMISQHHENLDGTGFPDRIRAKGFHPFGKIARVADEFCNLALAEKPETPSNFTEIIAKMADESKDKLDASAFTALVEVLNLKMPASYEASFNRRKT